MSMAGPVRSLEELVAQGLRERGLRPVHAISRHRSEYSTSAPLDEITVELADGSTCALMGKTLGPGALLEGARLVKPDFACSRVRESLVYAALATEAGPPECWGVVEEPAGPLLVLERVEGLALRHTGDLVLWQAAAAWIAGFHGRWDTRAADLPAGLRPRASRSAGLLGPPASRSAGPLGPRASRSVGPLGPHLLRYDRAHHELLLHRAEEMAAATGRSLAPSVVVQHDRAVEILETLPTSLIHGEYYASNVIIDLAARPARVAALDWEMAGTGSPFLDLAALVSGDWRPDERAAIVQAYREASSLDLPADGFERALVAAELLVSMQWMGWAPGWQPPPDLAGCWAANAEAKALVLGRSEPSAARAARTARQSGRGRACAATRHLIVNADDLGMCNGVNRGIFEAHDHGIVTSASLMVRGASAWAAAGAAAGRPGLALGLHVDLGEWCFRDGAWEAAYEVVDSEDPEAVEAELAHQLALFRSMVGRDPTHLDSHQHVHREPPVGAVLSRLAQELGVPLRGSGPIAYCGDFYGQLAKGEPYPEAITVRSLVSLIEGLPAGVTEVACHPGYVDLTQSVYAAERFVELQVLCDPAVSRAVRGAGVQLVSFADVSAR